MLKRARWVWLLLLLAGVPEAQAQPTTGPIPIFVVDARGSLARFKKDQAVADSLDANMEGLPTRGLGITAGAHVYLLRTRRITIGVGGEVVRAGQSRTFEDSTTSASGPTITTRLTAFSPQLSFNFGRDEGWSYFSGGLGVARLVSERDDTPLTATATRTRALNYGGGARWFNSPRMAFTFDLRFYAISPRQATAAVPGYPRAKFMVLSAGLAFK